MGNDNSVTGFDDQSDNIQKAPPTTAIPGNVTTRITTPTPTTTAILTVIKIVSGNTSATPSNFTMHITGNNPTPANFAGSSAGIVVKLDPGPFSVTETAPSGTFFTNTTAGDGAASIAQVCATFDQITEVVFRAGLIDLGIPGMTADELIACLKAAGIVFAP